MTTYRPKIKAVEAIQCDTNDIEAAEAFAGVYFDPEKWGHGDWIVRYPNGQYRKYLKDEFLQFFEPVEGGAAS
jgi:hypothetical protein